MRRTRLGFTLIELMVVLTVTGVILAYGVPSFVGLVKNSRLTSGVNQVVAAMHLARSEASKRRVPVVLCTSLTAETEGGETCSDDADWTDGWIVFADLNGNGDYDGVDEIISATGAQNKGLTVTAHPQIEHSITYLPTGFADLPLNTVSGRYIVYCDDSEEDRYSRVLSFSNSGRPGIVSRDIASGAPSCDTGS